MLGKKLHEETAEKEEEDKKERMIAEESIQPQFFNHMQKEKPTIKKKK